MIIETQGKTGVYVGNIHFCKGKACGEGFSMFRKRICKPEETFQGGTEVTFYYLVEKACDNNIIQLYNNNIIQLYNKPEPLELY